MYVHTVNGEIFVKRDEADGENVTALFWYPYNKSCYDNDFVVISIGLNQSNYFTSETVGSVMVC